LAQLSHVNHPKQQLFLNNAKPLASHVEWVVDVVHNLEYYAVMEIITTKKLIKIFDGLPCNLLGWQNHIITAMKKCMLLDLSVDSSSGNLSQIKPLHLLPQTVGSKSTR
jgi:hypothetical protein